MVSCLITDLQQCHSEWQAHYEEGYGRFFTSLCKIKLCLCSHGPPLFRTLLSTALKQVQLCLSLFHFFKLDFFALYYEPILIVLVCIPLAQGLVHKWRCPTDKDSSRLSWIICYSRKSLCLNMKLIWLRDDRQKIRRRLRVKYVCEEYLRRLKFFLYFSPRVRSSYKILFSKRLCTLFKYQVACDIKRR